MPFEGARRAQESFLQSARRCRPAQWSARDVGTERSRPLDEPLGEEVLLGGEVVVQRGEGHPRRLGDLAHRDLLVLALGEKPKCGVDDGLPASRLPGAQGGRDPDMGDLVLSDSSLRGLGLHRSACLASTWSTLKLRAPGPECLICQN